MDGINIQTGHRPVSTGSAFNERADKLRSHSGDAGFFSGKWVELYHVLNSIPNPNYLIFKYFPLVLCGGLSLLARTAIAVPIRNPLHAEAGASGSVTPGYGFNGINHNISEPLEIPGCDLMGPSYITEAEVENTGRAEYEEQEKTEEADDSCKAVSGGSVNKKTIVFMSDPQYPWSCIDDDAGCSDEKKAKTDIRNHIRSINELSECLGEDRFGGTVINGDLTAFGHQWQLDGYRSIVEGPDSGLKGKVFPAVGNHDVGNNINDCFMNRCASRMVHYLIDKVEATKPLDFDFKVTDSGFFTRSYSGSLAYSWNFGKIHLVQLNNYPTYEADWKGVSFDSFKMESFNITSSIPWLENDLAAARDKGQHIILNYHHPEFFNNKWEGILKFVDTLGKFNVSAIFSGHFHHSSGVYDNLLYDIFMESRGADKIPIFLSGSTATHKYLVADFLVNEGKFGVTVVDSTKKMSDLVWSTQYYPLR